jgi:hypothetical protein
MDLSAVIHLSLKTFHDAFPNHNKITIEADEATPRRRENRIPPDGGKKAIPGRRGR